MERFRFKALLYCSTTTGLIHHTEIQGKLTLSGHFIIEGIQTQHYYAWLAHEELAACTSAYVNVFWSLIDASIYIYINSFI